MNKEKPAKIFDNDSIKERIKMAELGLSDESEDDIKMLEKYLSKAEEKMRKQTLSEVP